MTVALVGVAVVAACAVCVHIFYIGAMLRMLAPVMLPKKSS